MKNSLFFGDIDLSKYLVVEKVDRPLLPKINTNTKQIANRDGIYFRNNTLNPLEIRISCRVINYKDLTNTLNFLDTFIYSKEIKPLNFDNNRSWYDAILIDTNIEKYRNWWALLELTFLIPSGTARSEQQKSISFQSNISKELSLDGNYPTTPTITLNSDDTQDVYIKNITTGKQIYINNINGLIIINNELNKITKNNESVMKNLRRDSEFFDIKDKDQIISNVYGTIKFYERYLYDVNFTR